MLQRIAIAQSSSTSGEELAFRNDCHGASGNYRGNSKLLSGAVEADIDIWLQLKFDDGLFQPEFDGLMIFGNRKCAMQNLKFKTVDAEGV